MKVVTRKAGTPPLPTTQSLHRHSDAVAAGTASWHHLFVSSLEPMKKNVSLTTRPDIRLIEHRHVFHTINAAHAPQRLSSTCNNHFHEINWVFDGLGNPRVAHCGPPLRHAFQRRSDGSRRKVTRAVAWGDVVDDHRHDFIYQFSEEVPRRE